MYLILKFKRAKNIFPLCDHGEGPEKISGPAIKSFSLTPLSLSISNLTLWEATQISNIRLIGIKKFYLSLTKQKKKTKIQ